ncbi:AMP-binding protein [Salinisphaera sp. USBA-960]|uniref:AMP-binding protein n=1 Tax=Salinisphaera orenii TaxID=856731 RepID=UPI000DBE95FD|nr:AMP-binding protein [Salifodinibacter halophilus]NNC26477.1 AMP-binding protein [Salifodinibacter halophilus]
MTNEKAGEHISYRSYPPGVAHTISLDPRRTLVDVLLDSCEAFGPQVAYTHMNARLTYDGLERQTQALAAYFQQELGLVKGDRLALMMPNLLQYPIALFAALRAGLIVVNVNPLYTSRELGHQLTDSGARAIVIAENFAATLTRTLADNDHDNAIEHVIMTRIGDQLPLASRVLTNFAVKHIKRMVPTYSLDAPITFRHAMKLGQRVSARFDPPELDGGDLAFLQYTGGTTGLAKGARLSHANMVANLRQASVWLEPWINRGQEHVITALPLYHVFALTANCLVFLEQGGNNRLVTNPRDIPGMVKVFKQHQPTVFTGVNTLFNALVNNPEFTRLDFSKLRLTLGGGASVQKPVADAWQQVTGTVLTEAYGLTETAPAVCVNRFDANGHTSKIGLPIPSTEVSIRDDDGHELGLNEPGELCVRGPQVMDNYWGYGADTANDIFTDDGYFRTGDIATLDDDGYLAIVDRKKDMINVSGFNVFPNEIESVIAEHAKVLEAGCIGIADAKSGEEVKAFVVKRDDSLTADELETFCRDRLTAYKVPRHIVFVDELPKSNVGKILRKELRAA